MGRATILEILLSNPCVMCGEDDILVLEFDHTGNKKGNVGRMMLDGASIERIHTEVSQCRVMCSNCHTVVTRANNNDYRWAFVFG